MATMSIDEALELAREHIQAGRVVEGAAICREILKSAPRDSEAHRILGMLACAAGKSTEAETHLRFSLAGEPESAQAHAALSMTFAAQGRYAAAECSARRALELRPDYPEAENNLGGALHSQGRLEEAAEAFRRALALRPEFAEAEYNFGYVLQAQKDWEGAAQAYRRALALRPDLCEAENNLGVVSQAQGRNEEAIEAYRRAMELQPGDHRPASNLGLLFQSLGRLDEAIAAYQYALALQPEMHEVANNLGIVLHHKGAFAEAVRAYRQALTSQPYFAEAENNLGNTLLAQGRPAESIAAYQRALTLRPEYAEAESNMGLAYHAVGHMEEAVGAFQRALSIRSEFAEAANNLGNSLLAQGDHEEALHAYRRALELRPGYLMANSNMLMCEQYRTGANPARLARLHAEWDERHVAPLYPGDTTEEWDLDRDPERPIRLGFVSPDLRRHPVGFFLVRALEHLDPRSFEVVCYHSRVEGDDLTARLEAVSKKWNVTISLSCDELARKIRDDRVDIAFDLMGHTSDHRLLTFASRPAPIQITWIGYVGTTGLRTMDYLIADRHHVPPGTESHYREKVLRMPDGYVCFDPPAEAPEVGPLPALGRGHVTFGSFNNVAKLTSELLDAWAEILRRVPGSRLLLVSPGLGGSIARNRVVEAMTSAGVDPSQLDIRGAMSRPEILAAYNTMDVALDTFPYSGGLTTCEALWMGVPVVTCPGESFAGRHSLSHLTNIGLTETIARDRREYVEIAVGLAEDLDSLAALRAGLRDQMAHSPLCDGPRFARNLEGLLRDVWRSWCRQAV